MKTFGNQLRQLRRKQGKSQQQVVSELESMFPGEMRISQTTLSALEQRDNAPREDVLAILCKYYTVPISYFFERCADDTHVDEVKAYIDLLRFYTPGSPEWFNYDPQQFGGNYEYDEDMEV